MKKIQPVVPLTPTAVRGYSLPRVLTTVALALILITPLIAVSGCDDVEGAASGTAGQMNERQKRGKEATDILDSGTKN